MLRRYLKKKVPERYVRAYVKRIGKERSVADTSFHGKP
jgi:hypothetical protein